MRRSKEKIDPNGPVDKEIDKELWLFSAESECPIMTIIYQGVNFAEIECEIKELLKSDLSNLWFTYFSHDERQQCLPGKSLKLLLDQVPDNTSIRVCDHPIYTQAVDTHPDPWQNESYFGGYSGMHIHWEMLSDSRRCEAYKKAIEENKDRFKDAVVLDVGCGTAILSCYCAMAGAKKVYAIDASDIIFKADLVVKENNFSDIIELIHGKIEEIELPVKTVDIIVSEWMGYFLIYESMLDTLIFARDKWLKKGGLLFPEKAVLYLAPIDHSSYFAEKVKFFEQPLFGVNLTSLVPFVKEEFTIRALQCTEIKEDQIITSGVPILTIDLYQATTTSYQLIHQPFVFLVPKSIDHYHGFVTWFEVTFPKSLQHSPVVLSTHPKEPLTHWKQDVFLFPDKLSIESHSIPGVIDVQQNPEWKRHYMIRITINLENEREVKREWAL